MFHISDFLFQEYLEEQKMYSAGDLIAFEINKETFYGEVLGIDDQNKVEVSRLRKTAKQESRIWEYVADDSWSAIDASYITQHYAVTNEATRSQIVAAWKQLGFVPGGDGITFCRLSDEESVTLPLYGGDESDNDSDEDLPSTKEGMHGYASDDGFIVPDDEGSEFEFADPDELDEEGAKFVRETHEAVHGFANWQPTDKQGHAIKAFIEKAEIKAAIETDNRRLESGKSSISTSKPPLKKRKK